MLVTQYAVKKEVKSKKVCSSQKGHCEKDVESKVAAKKWL